MKNIRAILFSILVVVIIGGYIVYNQFFKPTDAQTSPPNTTDNQNTQSSGTTGSSNNNQAGQAGLNDGQYTGEAVNAIFGTVQVKATIASGKITDIQFLQFPNSPGYTTQLSNQSMPILKSEAIAAQSVQVNIVSGATQTSQGFMRSLASALVKAGSNNQPDIQVTPPSRQED